MITKTFITKDGKRIDIVSSKRLPGYHRAPIEDFRIIEDTLLLIAKTNQTVCRRFFRSLEEGDTLFVFAGDKILAGKVKEKQSEYDDMEKTVYFFIFVEKGEERWERKAEEKATLASTK
ncbi:MAG: hypothetical protein QXK45_07600 [Thermofilaceae archaeon]